MKFNFQEVLLETLKPAFELELTRLYGVPVRFETLNDFKVFLRRLGDTQTPLIKQQFIQKEELKN